jgi:hypothetical protein
MVTIDTGAKAVIKTAAGTILRTSAGNTKHGVLQTWSSAMPDDITRFPPRRTRRKPTIVEIVNDCLKTGQTTEALAATIKAVHPDKSLADVEAAFRSEAVKDQTELECLEEILAVVEPICAEPGNEDIAVVQALWIAAERGNEQAIAFWHDLAIAVDIDPDWSVSEEGHAVCREGATHDSAEELVAAYRAGRIDDPRPIKTVVEKIILQAFRTHGLTLDNMDDADDTTRQSVNALTIRVARAHPRWTEIQHFFAEEGTREEIRRQCQERGIPLIED